MAKKIDCQCGETVRGDSDDERPLAPTPFPGFTPTPLPGSASEREQDAADALEDALDTEDTAARRLALGNMKLKYPGTEAAHCAKLEW